MIKQERIIQDASNKDLQVIFEVYTLLYRPFGVVLIKNSQESISVKIAFSSQSKKEKYIQIYTKTLQKIKYFLKITL